MKLDGDVPSALRRSPNEFANEMRLAAAIHWYKRGEISQEKAAQVAGLDRTAFLLALAGEGEEASLSTSPISRENFNVAESAVVRVPAFVRQSNLLNSTRARRAMHLRLLSNESWERS